MLSGIIGGIISGLIAGLFVKDDKKNEIKKDSDFVRGAENEIKKTDSKSLANDSKYNDDIRTGIEAIQEDNRIRIRNRIKSELQRGRSQQNSGNNS